MKEWKLKKVIQILTACLAMIVVLNVSGISMKTMQTIDINKKESKTNRRDSNLQMESETRETISRILNEQIQTELPQIAITFDDGPSVCTPALLDGLKERNVKATFFLVGENVETYPDIVKRIYEEGHLIGNHTYHHVEITKLSDEEAMYEINKTDELIEAITGQRVQYIRPPFGVWQRELENYLDVLPVMWTVDPLDWTTENIDEVVNKVVPQAKENDIILLHDCYKSSVEAALRSVDLLKADQKKSGRMEIEKAWICLNMQDRKIWIRRHRWRPGFGRQRWRKWWDSSILLEKTSCCTVQSKQIS